MYLLAVNGSPRGTGSNTDRILQPFLEGARDNGASTETVYLRDKKINHCTGCFACWTKTPGVCIHRDDMPDLLEKIRRADVLVYATPLYIFSTSGLMKDFMDRFIPLLNPKIIKRGDHYIHPTRFEQEWPKKVILISNCGYPEPHHFSGLEETFRMFTSGPDMELAATIFCAGGGFLGQPQLEESLRWYTDACRRAGFEMVLQGRISEETQSVLDRPLIANPEHYANITNAHWNSITAQPPQNKAEKALPSAGSISPALSPPPASSRPPETFFEAISGQATVFSPKAAGSLKADYQFLVTGKEPGEYVLRIDNGRCTVHDGTVSSPDITIHTPSEIWLQIARGELSGQTAYLQGLYLIEGDLGLLLRMGELFSSAGSAQEEIHQANTAGCTKTLPDSQKGPFRLPGMVWLALAFKPWIAYWIISHIPALSPGIKLGIPLLLSSVLWAYRRAFGSPTWMDSGTPLYFALAWLVTLSGYGFFDVYGLALGELVLAGLWFGTLATDTPLTAEYSKWKWDPALWTNKVFIKTNAIITAVWGSVFLAQSAVALLGQFDPGIGVLRIVLAHILLIPAFIFTAWFQRWYPAQGSLKPPAAA